MQNSTKAILFGGAAVLSWSTVATAFKVALAQLSLFSMLCIATFTALAIFAVAVTIDRAWPKVRSLSLRTLILCAVMGLLNPVTYYLVLWRAYDMLPAQVAQPVNYLWPIALLILLSAINHTAIPWRKYIGMAISLAGLTILSSGGAGIAGGVSATGMLMAVASALLWAIYWMLSDRLKRVVPESVALFIGFLFASVCLAGAMLFIPFKVPTWSALGAGVYVGAFEIGIPFICFAMALRLTDNPALINQMCYLAPFMSLFFISMILGETIRPTTYLGLTLIVAGIVYNQYFAEKRMISAGKSANQ